VEEEATRADLKTSKTKKSNATQNRTDQSLFGNSY